MQCTLDGAASKPPARFGTDSNDLPLLDMQFDFCGFVRQTLDTDLPDEEKLGDRKLLSQNASVLLLDY